MRTLCFLWLGVAVAVQGAESGPKPAHVFHVALDGADDNSGSAQQPFATLERARDEIRALKRPLGTGGVEVVVHGGEYRVRETFRLFEMDSGTTDAPIVYRAAEGAKPSFVGGVRLREFGPVTDSTVLARLEESVRDRVVAHEVGALAEHWICAYRGRARPVDVEGVGRQAGNYRRPVQA